jgi:hypothetical protein
VAGIESNMMIAITSGRLIGRQPSGDDLQEQPIPTEPLLLGGPAVPETA